MIHNSLNKRLPALYALLSQEEKDKVSAAMKEYNGASLDETFNDPEQFFHTVYNHKTLFYHIRRAA